MKKIIIYLFIVICMLQLVRADITWSMQYNSSNLPVSGFAEFNFSLTPNATIYFTAVSLDNRSNLTFPTSITLPYVVNVTDNVSINVSAGDVSIGKLDVNYSIPFFANVPDTSQNLLNTIGVTNNVNPNLLLLHVNFLVYTPALVNITNTTYNNFSNFMQVSDNGLQVLIRTYSLLSFNQTHLVKINAQEGSIINITCGQFLSCPANMTVPYGSNNQTSWIASIYVPQYTSPSNYTSLITMTLLNLINTTTTLINGTVISNETYVPSNTTATITFTIDVEGISSSQLNYQIWDANCFTNPTTLANCYKAQADYNANIANALLSRLSSCNLSNDSSYITAINETIKYVEVGDIDKNLLDNFNALRDQYNTVVTNYNSLSTQYKTCVDDKGKMTNDLTVQTASLQADYASKQDTLNQQMLVREDANKKKIQHTVNWFFGAVSILLIVSLLFGMYLEANWAVQHFPKLIIFIIFCFFLLGWIITAFILR